MDLFKSYLYDEEVQATIIEVLQPHFEDRETKLSQRFVTVDHIQDIREVVQSWDRKVLTEIKQQNELIDLLQASISRETKKRVDFKT